MIEHNPHKEPIPIIAKLNAQPKPGLFAPGMNEHAIINNTSIADNSSGTENIIIANLPDDLNIVDSSLSIIYLSLSYPFLLPNPLPAHQQKPLPR